MASGGARNRSGPPPQEGSASSERRGYTLTALPAEGYQGEIPEFPLPKMPIRQWVQEDKRRWQEIDEDSTEAFRERELQVWAEAWRSPQACAWSLPSEMWRIRTIALWVRLSVRCEDAEIGAAHLAQLHRFADQIGMTTAGLAEMGWKVAVDEVAEKAASRTAPAKPQERRLRAASDGA